MWHCTRAATSSCTCTTLPDGSVLNGRPQDTVLHSMSAHTGGCAVNRRPDITACRLLTGVDVLPLFRLLYAQVAASCGALATALQLRKGLKHVRSLNQG